MQAFVGLVCTTHGMRQLHFGGQYCVGSTAFLREHQSDSHRSTPVTASHGRMP